MNGETNMKAFLWLVRVAEGTSDDNGYRAMFGHRADRPKLFTTFADHPRIRHAYGAKYTTAAGAYQFLAGTWDDCRAKLGLLDFSPGSQDRAAVYLITRRGALDDVKEGRFVDAVRKCSLEWASLPFSPYGQPRISLESAMAIYQGAGGAIVHVGNGDIVELRPHTKPAPAPAPAPIAEPAPAPVPAPAVKVEVRNGSLISATPSIFQALRKGYLLTNASTWKNRALLVNTVAGLAAAVLGVLKIGFGYDFGIDEVHIEALASAVVGVLAAVNGVVHVTTSAKVGVGREPDVPTVDEYRSDEGAV
jgi:muramidase (phage lysozyme)